MKAAVVPEYGGPEVFQMEERPDPEPRRGEIVIAVKAAGVNFADIMGRLGLYPDAPKPPMALGYEVAGDVEKVGADVEAFAAGDKVFSLTMFGGYAEKAAVPAHATRPIPADLSYEEAAAIPVNYLTAHHSIVYMGNLKPFESVLIHAAAGGVGTAATQMARSIGATIYGTASPAKFDYIKENGVEHPIDYISQDFEAEILNLTGGRGVDLILDALGGRQLQKSYNCLAPAGRLVTFGMSSIVHGARRRMMKAAREVVRMARFHPLKMMSSNRAVIGVNMNPLARKEPEIISRQLDDLVKMLEEGAIKPHIDTTFPLEKVGEAHKYIQDRLNRGKVVLTI